MVNTAGKYDSAASRWAGVGPYYAMFPSAFADSVIGAYTRRGDVVLDPFAGRGTAIFSAAISQRRGVGVEISPVGWVYAQTKLWPASHAAVAHRLTEISRIAYRHRAAAKDMPPFFHWCYQPNVLEFLLAARNQLNWRNSSTDRTTMAILLINLHGKRDDSLSNQMRQTKSMSPAYAINWWRKHRLRPPELDPAEFLEKRLAWRYAKGVPKTEGSRVYLGDSSRVLRRVRSSWLARDKRARLLFTSPPYYGITNYYYDQWLRLWLLGGQANAARLGGRFTGKFENKEEYANLLLEVFANAKKLLARDATIYVRTDRRRQTLTTTLRVLTEVFPLHSLRQVARPYTRPTQTRLFGPSEPRVGEMDLILTR